MMNVMFKINAMKKMFGFILFVGWGCVVSAQRVLNIDSCRNLALANNKSLLISKEKMQKARYDRKAAFTNFLPDFSAADRFPKPTKF